MINSKTYNAIVEEWDNYGFGSGVRDSYMKGKLDMAYEGGLVTDNEYYLLYIDYLHAIGYECITMGELWYSNKNYINCFIVSDANLSHFYVAVNFNDANELESVGIPFDGDINDVVNVYDKELLEGCKFQNEYGDDAIEVVEFLTRLENRGM